MYPLRINSHDDVKFQLTKYIKQEVSQFGDSASLWDIHLNHKDFGM